MARKFSSFLELYDELRENPDLPVVEYCPVGSEVITTLTAGQFCKKVLARRVDLLNLGVSRIAFISDKTPELLVDIFASLTLGITICLIDPSEPLDKMMLMLRTFKPEYIIMQEEEFESEELREIKSAIAPWHVLKSIDKEGDMVFFTSGTSGPNKGVVLSSKALLASAYCGQSKCPCNENDIILSALPLSHVFGFICTFLWPLCYHATIALGRGMRKIPEDPKFFAPTIIPVIPALVGLLAKMKAFNPELKLLLVGAGNLAPSLVKLINASGIGLALGYGLTETASGVAIAVRSSDPYKMEACPGNSFKIEEDGTLAIKSDSIMKGYLTQEGFKPVELDKEGYFHTSDLAKLDENGRLTVLGRKDDIFVLPNGTKFDAAEAEMKLAAFFPALDFALAYKNEKVTFVYYSPKDISLEVSKAVEAFNKDQPLYNRIGAIEKREAPLPRTKTMKVMRYRL